MIKYLLIIFITINLFGNISVDNKIETPVKITEKKETSIFGENLFNGNFKESKETTQNDQYIIKPGDKIAIKIWGIMEFNEILTVDNLVNIFIPEVGIINLSNKKALEIQDVIKESLYEIYKGEFSLYANLLSSQPISVFVSGNVNAPGLYTGAPSNTILNFIDMADGINLDYGSYRLIDVVRDNSIVKSYDLYDFILNGRFDKFQLLSEDVILVNNIGSIVNFSGDVLRPYRFEVKDEDLNILLNSYAIPVKGASKMVITNNFQKMEQQKTEYKITETNQVVYDGDEIQVKKEHFTKYINISITGEHYSAKNIIVEKGASLKDLVTQIQSNVKSDMSNIQIFRKSIASRQKELLLDSLRDLELKLLTQSRMGSSSTEAIKAETSMLLQFIERAREVEPKGQMIVENTNQYDSIILEENDVINVPSKHNMVLVQGSVLYPTAIMWEKDLTYEDYIERSGGFADNANDDYIILVKQNGRIVKVEDSFFTGYKSDNYNIEKTDAIMVMPKVSSYTLDVMKDVTTIMYNIAIAAKVALGL